MLKMKDILDEKETILRTKSDEVTFPLKKEEKTIINDMIKFLQDSQTEEIAEKYNLRPGMGLAAIQLGIKKRFFVIVEETEDGFDNYVIINPKIISNSQELIYAAGGEGCLSINREIIGIIPRYARITCRYQDEKGDFREIRVREEIAIAFQHEKDHLEGILCVDKINPENPFKDRDTMRMI